MPTQQLTAHFTLDEMIQSQTAARMGISNVPNADELTEVKATADLLERIRDRLSGKPILISSGFRNSASIRQWAVRAAARISLAAPPTSSVPASATPCRFARR
jgi:hypothetical protein